MEISTHDRLYGILHDTLQGVHGQLQFAEAKNGALLAVNLATVVGIGAIVSSEQVAASSLRMWLFVTCLVLAAAAVVALTSFLPIMGANRHDYARGQAEGGNLVYWGEIMRFSPVSYLDAVAKAVGIDAPGSRLHLDLADQIVINSGIASRKFTRFQLAAGITLAGSTVPALVLAFTWIGAGGRFL